MSDIFFREYSDAAVLDQTKDDGELRFRNDYFGRSSSVRTGCEGFLVNHPREILTRAHFHPVDQFQVFFGNGTSTFKNAIIPHLMVHYADAFTTYGPFNSGGGPFKFFTLRKSPTSETYFMPESRSDLPKATRRRRYFTADLDDELRKPRPANGMANSMSLFGDKDGTLTARLVSAGPHATIEFGPVAGAGAFFLVLDGTVRDDSDLEHDQMALGWSDGIDRGLELYGGPQGCSLLYLQF